jgi:hypothetical protein
VTAPAWHHGLEPPALVAHFVAHPPQDFKAGFTEQGLPWFEAELDLSTTLDDALRRRVRSLPLYRLWGRWLRWRTAFVGTTVTEYAPLPQGVPPAALMQPLLRGPLQAWRRAHKLLIVKDIPADSPLLGDADRAQAGALTQALQAEDFVLLEGQALAWVPIDFESTDAYLMRLSAKRRKDIRRKLRNLPLLDIRCVPTGDPWLADAAVRQHLYSLYEEVYAQSEIHFDKLTPAFFDAVLQDPQVQGRLFVYREGEVIVGWNLCFEHGDTWVDKYIGLHYPRARELSLFVINWMRNLEHARALGKRQFVAGWTDPQIKADLGAQFSFTRHAIHPRNALLRWLLRRLAGLFEGDRQWFDRRQRGGD